MTWPEAFALSVTAVCLCGLVGFMLWLVVRK
jgi:hypothetical protein